MTALDFPDNPAVGEQYGSASTQWRWNGTLWESTAGASGGHGLVANLAMAAGTITQPTAMVATPIVNTQTVQVQAGRRYRVTFTLRAATVTAAGAIVSEVVADGVSLGEYWTWVQSANTSVNHQQLWVPTTTGAHTISVTLKGWGVGFTAYADPPGMCLVEDITYEAGSSAPAAPLAPMFRSFTANALSVVTATTTVVPFVDQAGDAMGNVGNPAVGAFMLNEKGVFVVDMMATWSTSYGAPGVVPDLYNVASGASIGSQASIAPWGVTENSWLLDQKQSMLANQYGLRFYNYMATMNANVVIRVARVSARP